MKDLSINPVSALLVGALLNSLGALIKAVPGICNHWIPFILAALGGLIYGLLEGFTGQNIVIGLGLALGAVGAHQALQQGKAAVQAGQTPPQDPP